MTTVVRPGHRTWAIEWSGQPNAEELQAALDEVAAAGDSPVQVWVSMPTPEHDAVAASVGLVPGRDLHQLRVPLPLVLADASPGREERAGLQWRPFRPGHDEAAWLDVNNRAFAWHPEQGGWTLEMLRDRLAEPWVDLEGFLVHERDGRLAGSCWTKVHADHDPPLGEIYVVSVDPDLHGLGIGRALTIAALEWLHRERGISTGMLYVDASNEAAMQLYRGLGFTSHHLDRAYKPLTPTADPMA